MASKKRLSLADLMTAKDVTRAAVAEKLGVSRQVVSNWRQGHFRPHKNSQKLLAELLGITEKALLLAIEESARRREARDAIGE